MILKRVLLIFLFFATVGGDLYAQVVINGRSPRRYPSTGRTAISVSYGNLFWVDGNNLPLRGSSAGTPAVFSGFDPFSVERWNQSTGISFGFEKGLAHRFSIRSTISTAKLSTGINGRLDLITEDESRITQLGVYSRYTLTKELDRRLQFQWIAGPELIYARKDILVKNFVPEGSAEPPVDFKHHASVLEGTLVTGLGASYRISGAFAVFSDGMLGISLPGKGLKITNSGLGLKYSW